MRSAKVFGYVLLSVLGVPFLLCVEGAAQDTQSSTTTPTPSASSQQATNASATDATQAIAKHLAIGKALLAQGDCLGAQAEFRAILSLDATYSDALRLMTKSQQQFEAQQAKAQRAQGRLRAQAQDLALKLVREKADARVKQEAQAKTQVAHAREQQVKLLYNRGLGLYRQGDFQAAIDTFQQMVLLDPTHPLVRDAQRLMTQAETKQAAEHARATVRAGPPLQGPGIVSALEQQLTAKRIELETQLKYAKLATQDHQYAMAIELLQKILVQDPQNRQAQELLEQVQMAKLKEEEQRLQQQVTRDEQTMINEVVRAQVLPQVKPMQMINAPAAQSTQQAMAAKLRQPITLDFNDVALSDVLEFIGDAANVSIIPSPQLDLKTRRVSLKITQLPLELALKYLARNQSLAYRVEQDAILIASSEEFSNEPLETRVFFLRNGLGPFALETAAMKSNPALAMESMKDLILHSVPQPTESKIVADERSGALIVTNTKDHLALVERLLSQLDVTPLQVLIEARFIEVTMSDLDQLGLESVLTGNYALTKESAGNGTLGPGIMIGKGGGVKFPNLSRQDEGANITLEGVLTGLQFETALHALEESKKGKTLSAPRVTTLNNQTATIKVVDEFNYPTRYEVSLVQFDINGDGDFDDAGETEFVNVPKDFQKRDVGILLNVTPSVGKDLKTITLVLAPEVSQAGAFRDLGGGVSVPDFTSSQLTTSVVIEDGQTVMLGGLMKDTTSDQVTKVPVLGDLPFIGGLFRQKEVSSTRKNLLIFITARLLAPRGQTT